MKPKPYPFGGGKIVMNVWYDVSKVNPRSARVYMMRLTDTKSVFVIESNSGEYSTIARDSEDIQETLEHVDNMEDAMAMALILARMS